MKSLRDNESVHPLGSTGMDGENGEGRSGVIGNERLTALAGAVLLVLIVVELVTVPNLRALLSVHVLVGVLLAGPLAVKLGSTGYRFLRYYTGSPAYVRKGPHEYSALAPADRHPCLRLPLAGPTSRRG